MKLTSEQINHLYQFTRQHYVEWYDLQTELVDHLANSIETQWAENLKISFEDALQIEFKKFGVCGFMDVVATRKVALKEKYNRLAWKLFKCFFSIPKITVTIGVFVLLIQLMLIYKFASIVIITLFMFSAFVFWIGMVLIKRKNKKQSRISGKKWLYKDIIYDFGTLGGLSYLPLQLALKSMENLEYTIIPAVLISLTVISVTLFNYVILIIIPSKAEQYLKETYPEY